MKERREPRVAPRKLQCLFKGQKEEKEPAKWTEKKLRMRYDDKQRSRNHRIQRGN